MSRKRPNQPKNNGDTGEHDDNGIHGNFRRLQYKRKQVAADEGEKHEVARLYFLRVDRKAFALKLYQLHDCQWQCRSYEANDEQLENVETPTMDVVPHIGHGYQRWREGREKQ